MAGQAAAVYDPDVIGADAQTLHHLIHSYIGGIVGGGMMESAAKGTEKSLGVEVIALQIGLTGYAGKGW